MNVAKGDHKNEGRGHLPEVSNMKFEFGPRKFWVALFFDRFAFFCQRFLR